MNRNSKMPYRSGLKAPPTEQSRLCQPATVQRGPGGTGLRPPQTRSGIPSARTGLPVPKSGIPARAQKPSPCVPSGIPGIPRSGIPSTVQRGYGIPSNVQRGYGIPSTAQRGSGIPSTVQRGSGIPSTAQRGLRLPQAGRTPQIALPEAVGRGNRIPENTSQPTRRPPLGTPRCPRLQEPVRPKCANPAMSALPSATKYNPPVRTPPVRYSPVHVSPTPATTYNSPVRTLPARNSPVHVSPTPVSCCRESPCLSSPARSYPMRSPVDVSPAISGFAYNASETPVTRRSSVGTPVLRRALRMDESNCEVPAPQTDFSEPYHSAPVEPSPVRLVDLSVDETDLNVQECQEREELNNALSVVQGVRRSYLQNMPLSQSSSPSQGAGNPYNQLLMRRIEEFGGYVSDLDEEEMPEYMYSDELEEELNPLHEWCRQPYSEPCPTTATTTEDLIDMDTDPWTYSTELYRLVQM